MALTQYKKKRDFSKTKEPPPRIKRSKAPIYVIQEHHARRLHWDFRLELDGVLKSWAVPKGPPETPGEKRLAVEVEDHPLEYAKFHGTIPKGEYGAGEVFIWDKGFWKTDSDPYPQMKKGHLEFELDGERLHGKWMLVRTSLPSKQPSWLLIKRTDSKPLPLKSKKKVVGKVKNGPLPDFVAPQLATLVDKVPVEPNWGHEIKFDGYRTLARKNGKKVTLYSRSGLDWTAKYPEIASEIKKLKVKTAYLDGEVVSLDEHGVSRFDTLQQALSSKNTEDLKYFVFDLLYLNGEDLRSLPLRSRQERLKKLISENQLKRTLISESWSDGPGFFKAACTMKLEGVVSKNKDSDYQSGRERNWLKIKCKNIQEFVIGGYTFQKGISGIGALLVGAYDGRGRLQYLGRVGTGFAQQTQKAVAAKLKKLETKISPFGTGAPKERGARWVKPTLVANVEFGSWTDQKILRHAAFKGLREDKKPLEVTLEVPAGEVKLTNPTKVLYPKVKVTKSDMLTYYEQIKGLILPHVVDRPLSLLRCPNGQGSTCFFQKHIDSPLNGVDQQRVKSKTSGKVEDLLLIHDAQGLSGLVQMGVLEIHNWGTHVENLDKPDLIVFDLDPDPAVKWPRVVDAAKEMKELLDSVGLTSFLKVSGNKGLHLHVPIEPKFGWVEVKEFARAICQHLVDQNPTEYLITASKAQRKNKIFLDYLRNGFGATSIAPYSLRAQPDATIALPIPWKELSRLSGAGEFTLKSGIGKRKNPWPDYFEIHQSIDRLK